MSRRATAWVRTFLLGLGSMAFPELASAVPLVADEERNPQLVMQDQFGAEHDLSKLRGDVVVLVFADRGGAEASRELGAKLHVEFHPAAAGQPPDVAAQAPPRAIPRWPADRKLPDARIVAIGVIGDVPKTLHAMVRYRFRKVAPEGVIWLDLRDDIRRQFKLVADVPNVAVIDKQGQLRYRTWGELSPEKYGELIRAIEILRRERPTVEGDRVARQPPSTTPANARR
ncbi:MAG: hypothetical protein K1X74_04955 [Pirellulales bacterium]|nr:hypothetical protein [Pirellulales bacterium]